MKKATRISHPYYRHLGFHLEARRTVIVRGRCGYVCCVDADLAAVEQLARLNQTNCQKCAVRTCGAHWRVMQAFAHSIEYPC